MKRLVTALFVAFFFALSAVGKTEPPIIMQWPPEKPALKLSFEKFRQQGSFAGQSVYLADVTIENITDTQIPRANFTVYFFDKNKVRIGQGMLTVADLDAGQSAKMQFQFNSVGVPASLTLSAKKDMLAAPSEKTIPVRILSTPSGAVLKVDGKESGITPVIVRVTVGSHQLELTKEGYAHGSTPLEVTPDELPGGSITVELGGLSRDTVELRDGTVILGDVMSLSMEEVTVRVEGKDQTYPRNQVKKLILVERVREQEHSTPAPSVSAAPK